LPIRTSTSPRLHQRPLTGQPSPRPLARSDKKLLQQTSLQLSGTTLSVGPMMCPCALKPIELPLHRAVRELAEMFAVIHVERFSINRFEQFRVMLRAKDRQRVHSLSRSTVTASRIAVSRNGHRSIRTEFINAMSSADRRNHVKTR
jgi:hypothetical protein